MRAAQSRLTEAYRAVYRAYVHQSGIDRLGSAVHTAILGRGRRSVGKNLRRVMRGALPVSISAETLLASVPPVRFRCGRCGRRVGEWDGRRLRVGDCPEHGELDLDAFTVGELKTRAEASGTIKLTPVE